MTYPSPLEEVDTTDVAGVEHIGHSYWVHLPPSWCPKHGDQGGLVAIQIDYEGPIVPEAQRHRRYCWCCWIEWMDRGMCQLQAMPTSVVKEGGE